ncbi:hypothetical protein ACET3Z_016490 [Daucus carota]
MARSNKYASLNFNDIYDKKNNNPTKTLNNNTTTGPSPSLNKTKITNSRIHGNMLVLTRPTPKPISAQTQAHTQTPPPQQPKTTAAPVNPDPTRLAENSDSISLRPLGSTGGSVGVSRLPLPRDSCFVSGKVEKFVPPHLRPGYICKEEKPVSPGKSRQRQLGEEGSRPKSGGGGGYDRMKRGSAGPDFVFRPGSSGYTRPNSSG